MYVDVGQCEWLRETWVGHAGSVVHHIVVHVESAREDEMGKDLANLENR